ncbi:MAG: cyclopropane-fatty-acyl-phospholipid synthase [Gammaproteobacteria bacterium]|nr:cyclopropane-fatty-acyl-phospholipid synthase [Gammaproteobacteria bacterium]MCY4357905.1 cyclopropane-fatty-acyl-phospholipid synthase [Gammaproteobacteria bacterium]
MTQKDLGLRDEPLVQEVANISRTAAFVRQILIQVLSHASEGHFILRENGRIIAEVGSKSDNLQAEVNVLNTKVYARALIGGDTAAGEAFIDGWWTTPDIASVTRFFARNLSMMDYWGSRFGWMLKPFMVLRLLKRMNSRTQAKRNILAHYDLGNDLYQSFLDERMQYSSAIYNTPEETLSKAQTNKLKRLCEQLQLSENDHLLEVGTGWGGLAVYAAKYYGCRVTTTTISDQQLNFSRQRVAAEGLNDRVEVLDRDYRLLEGSYDKIVSVEMIEAVGRKFLPGFFEKLNSLLKPGGLLMLQAITIADQRFKEYCRSEDFIQKHVFPGGFLPSMAVMSDIMSSKTELVVRDILDIGQDYAQTLAHWRERFATNRLRLNQHVYDDKFCNLWMYYLGYCEGGFHERRISAVQMLASKAPHR